MDVTTNNTKSKVNIRLLVQIPVGATSAVRDDDGKIWIGGDLRGLIRIDFENQIYHNFQNNPQDNNTLLSNNVSCLYKDRDGNIWIGTDKGVSMYAHKYNSIRHYRKIPGKPDLALACMKTSDGSKYLGRTCLTLRMAYHNARLLARVDRSWLMTSVSA